MKKTVLWLVLLACLLAGCAPATQTTEQKQYTATFLTLFDTVTTIVGRAESEEVFHEKAQDIHDRLLEYHRLFDIYTEYDGMNNLRTVNDHAGIQPVKVDKRILDLIEDCRGYYGITSGSTNIAMGSVLYLWHEARSDSLDDPANAYLPDDEKLKEAALHTDFDQVIIDREASTLYLADPAMRLDVGAVAKGWAVQRVAEESPSGMLISVGGNVCATGPKDESGTPWVIGIQNPDGDDYLHTVYLTRGSVVTSGDYQRAYSVGNELYHHIIDPHTLYPSLYWRSVTVICEDSGDADALSTALFVLPCEDGKALLRKYGAEAMWVAADGSILYSEGFEKLIRT